MNFPPRSQWLVHIGKQGNNLAPGQSADIRHQVREFTGLVERLHECPKPRFDIEQDCLRARCEFLAHDGRGDQRD